MRPLSESFAFSRVDDVRTWVVGESGPTYSVLESDSQESFQRFLLQRLMGPLCRTNLRNP
jgi:hypothetical protein